MWPLNAKQIYEIVTGNPCPNAHFEKLILQGISQDSRKIKPNQMFVAVKGDKYDGHNYLKQCFQNKVQLALVHVHSPVLNELTKEEKESCICVENVTDALRKLAKYMRQKFPFPVIGIGGSNGKTTTKEILYSMLLGRNNIVTKTDKSENGYLGLALTLLQESHNVENPPSALVLEIGIDEVGAMQKHLDVGKPDIVLLTALGPEHLTGLNNWDTAIKEEFILFSSPQSKKIWQLFDPKIRDFYVESVSNDYAVIEKNESVDYKKNNRIIWSILAEKEASMELLVELYSHNKLMSYHFNLPLLGKHNAANFALAFATALCVGMTPEEIEVGFKKFIPPPMRSNLVTLPNGAVLYDDTYNASPLSMEVALHILEKPLFVDKPKLVVLGDMLELGTESNYWHEYLVPTLKK
ncbi:MAG: UDP-N-acetylmuramoyl-tripeptide--D-alanyl-D-alanine ligase, partial [Bdellovibrionota bacterium]